MKKSSSLSFFMKLAKLQSVMARRLDASLNGVSFNECIILDHLSQAPDEKLRRGELADMLGLTASGITRLLLPMEKIGLVKREINEHDARVSYVLLARGGKHKLEEALELAEILLEDLIPENKRKKLEDLSGIVGDLSVLVK